jgi:hypothetical protein
MLAPMQHERFFAIFMAISAALATAYLSYLLIFYATLQGYIDHIEPNIAIGAWRFLEGYNLFQTPDEWPLFIGYGPLLNLIHAAVFDVLGGSILTSKLANTFAGLFSVFLFFFYALRQFGIVKASTGIILFIGLMLIYSPFSFWSRPDPFILFFVTLAVATNCLSREKCGRWTPHLIVGACIGLAVNLKAHAFIYFIPIVIDICGWKGIRQMVAIGLISIITFLLPFMHPQISITQHVLIIFENLSGHNRFDFGQFITALKYSLFFLSPGLLLIGLTLQGRRNLDIKDVIYFMALSICVTLAIFPSSNVGMGTYHMFPLAAITVDSILRFSRGFDGYSRIQKGILVILPLLFIAISIPVQRRLMRNLDRIVTENTAQEVHRITEQYRNESIQIGYGQSFKNYRFSYFKIIPMFTGQSISIDAQTIMEFNLIGQDFTPNLTADILACKTQHWLIPKNEKPFRLKSYYTNKRLFGQAPSAFLKRYEITKSYKYFDVWSCKS